MADGDHAVDAPFADLVVDLVGLPAWNVKQGHGSFLTFEFGDPTPARIGNVVHGAWHLWIYLAMWRIETADEVLAGSEDDRDFIAAALSRLEGYPLTAVRANGPALDTEFGFGPTRLRTFLPFSRIMGRDRASWLLFRPDEQVLSVMAGGTWAHRSATG